MQRPITKLAIIFSLLFAFACSSSYKVWQRQVNKNVKNHLAMKPNLPTPPNTIWIDGNLFIDKTEVVNLSYLEYLHYMSEDSSYDHYQSQIPTTGAWMNRDIPFSDSVKLALSLGYLEYEGYRFLPVVGVSHEQAINYCKWRSEAVTQSFVSSRDTKYTFEYRLPTEKEWEKAALATIDTLNEENLKYGFNLASVPISSFNLSQKLNQNIEDSLAIPPTVYAYQNPTNLFGLHHTIGNVAEMITEKGIAKGGSWMHVPLQSTIKERIRYNYPTAWLGFRCVCEVKEKP
ncbi:formylglycine-generating enzyme family protein [Bernardetia sp.]|uniref:formylglycine-generating enzyme family protein n=1 Tax=Bernardetia sp. TaxID=1937974 RepID=UPI0025B87FAB|nr:SUMF1/EgtB/PvdO family nonheme iron enzyme [Bernardetia sp.]